MPSGGSELFILARGFQEFFFFFLFHFSSYGWARGDLRAGFSKWAPSSLCWEIKNEKKPSSYLSRGDHPAPSGPLDKLIFIAFYWGERRQVKTFVLKGKQNHLGCLQDETWKCYLKKRQWGRRVGGLYVSCWPQRMQSPCCAAGAIAGWGGGG